MGYTLIIGELTTSVEYDGLSSYVEITAKSEKKLEAPAFGEPTDHLNQRWPSYSVWKKSMMFVGLDDLMFNEETGLIRNHPGCVPLVDEHKQIIDKAYDDFYKKYPNAKAGYSPKVDDKNVFVDPEWPEENDYAVRLEWLKYWVDWSLKNCKHPMFCNT